MKINEPVGDAKWGPLLIRLPLGAYFALAGWTKLHQLAAFIGEVKKMGILPENLASLYGTALPYIEVAVGSLLIIGMWTTLAAMVGAILIFTFIVAFGFFPGENGLFNRDLILLGVTLSLLYSGCGAYGVDKLKNG